LALEAIRGEKTVAEIAAHHEVHPTQVTSWKNQVLEHLADIFGSAANIGVNKNGDGRKRIRELMHDRDYAHKVAEENLSFLRTDRAFDKCMENAHRKWRWVHKKLA